MHPPKCLLYSLVAFLPLLLLAPGCTRQSKIDTGIARGKAYFDKDEFEKAKITYLGVVQLDPNNAEAIKRLGLIWAEQGVPLEAMKCFAKARELIPNDLVVREKLANAFLDLQQMAEARKEAETILSQEPEQRDALRILVQTARSEQEGKDLEARLQKLKEADAGVLLAKGLLALRRNDLPAAASASDRATDADPKFSDAHYVSGLVALAQRNPARAEEQFKQASTLVPRSVASLAYAQLLLQKGDSKGAADFLDQFSKTASDYVPYWLVEAQTALNNKNPDGAFEKLQRVFLIDPANYNARMLKGQALLSKDETDKAIDVFKGLSEDQVYGGMAAPKLELAKAYVLKPDLPQAVAVLTQAVKLQPDYQEAVLLLAQLKLQQGNPQGIVESIQTLLRKTPNLLPAQLLLSQAYRSQGNLPEAARTLQEQIQAEPNVADLHLLLGLVLLQQNKLAEARQAFDTVNKLTPGNLLATYYLDELDLGEKKFDEASRRAQKLLQDTPNTPGPLYVLARVNTAQQRWDDDEQELKKSIQLDPNFTDAYDLLISNYVKNRKLEQASSQTEEFLAHNPQNTGALLTLAVIQEQLKNFEKAQAIYQKVIGADPSSSTALNNLAIILADRFGQTDKAYELASRARNLQPENALIADTLGWIAYRRKEYQQAASLLQESADKLPEAAEVQYHFGMASYMTGRTDVARIALTKAAAATGDFPGKSEIPRTLSLLAGKPDVAQSLSDEALEAAIKENPADLVSCQILSSRLEKRGDVGKAAGVWEEALKADQKLLPATLALAKLNAGPLHNPAKALEYAKRARSLAPNDPDVTNLTGRAAYQNGDFNTAYTLLQAAARSAGANAELLSDFAWAAYYQGRIDEARNVMQQKLNAKPNAPDADDTKQFLEFTLLEGQSQDLFGKVDRIHAVLSNDTGNVPALMLQAKLDTQQNHSEVASAIYAGILARLPNFTLAQKRLAAIYMLQPGRLNDAFDLATKARRSLPDDPELAQTLAAIRYQRKEYPSVVQLLQESSTKIPLNPQLLFYLGMSRLQQKQKLEGYSALEQALTAGLKNPEAAEAKQTLANKAGS